MVPFKLHRVSSLDPPFPSHSMRRGWRPWGLSSSPPICEGSTFNESRVSPFLLHLVDSAPREQLKPLKISFGSFLLESGTSLAGALRVTTSPRLFTYTSQVCTSPMDSYCHTHPITFNGRLREAHRHLHGSQDLADKGCDGRSEKAIGSLRRLWSAPMMIPNRRFLSASSPTFHASKFQVPSFRELSASSVRSRSCGRPASGQPQRRRSDFYTPALSTSTGGRDEWCQV